MFLHAPPPLLFLLHHIKMLMILKVVCGVEYVVKDDNDSTTNDIPVVIRIYRI